MDLVVHSTTEACQLAQWLILATRCQFTVEKMYDDRVIFYVTLPDGTNDSKRVKDQLEAYLRAAFIVVTPHTPTPARPA